MRSTKWPCGEQRSFSSNLSCHRMDFGSFKGFIQREWRKNSRKPFRQHCFSSSGRTNQNCVMAASGSDLQGTLDVLLTLHVFEVALVTVDFALKDFASINRERFYFFLSFNKGNCLFEIFHANDFEVVYNGVENLKEAIAFV